jgi:hypothetical protein
MFCSVRNYHMGDIDALTKFLGHYNDLEYGRVYSKLCRMLPPPPMHMLLEGEDDVTGAKGGSGNRRRGGKSWRKNAENVDDVVVPSSREVEDDPLEGGSTSTEVAP